MKMAKADKADIDAAGDLMVILNSLADGYYPVLGDPDDDTPTFFDPDDRAHLRHLYDLIAGLLDRAPGFQGRIIAGMAYVILYSKNEIIDPDSDTLDLHPKHVRNAVDAARYRWLRDKCDRWDGGLVVAEVTEFSLSSWSGDDLNAAIDAAMSKEGSND